MSAPVGLVKHKTVERYSTTFSVNNKTELWLQLNQDFELRWTWHTHDQYFDWRGTKAAPILFLPTRISALSFIVLSTIYRHLLWRSRFSSVVNHCAAWRVLMKFWCALRRTVLHFWLNWLWLCSNDSPYKKLGALLRTNADTKKWTIDLMPFIN